MNSSLSFIKTFERHIPTFEECDFSYIGQLKVKLSKPIVEEYINFLYDSYFILIGSYPSAFDLLRFYNNFGRYRPLVLRQSQLTGIDMSKVVEDFLEKQMWKKIESPVYLNNTMYTFKF